MDLPYGLSMRGIIKNEYGKILMLRRHIKSKHNPHEWEFPGGKVDKGEFFDEGLIREIKEETGLNVVLGDFCEAVQENYPHRRTVQLIIYIKYFEGEISISDEHDMWMWASLEEIKNNMKVTPTVSKILKKRNGEI